MKLKGMNLDRVSIEIVPIPRGYDNETGEKLPDLYFKCKTVPNLADVAGLVKRPEPPAVIKPGGVKEENYSDPTYLAKLEKYNRARYDYMILESLTATEGLEWETVKMSDPSTWVNWETEMRANFTEAQISAIQDGVMAANTVSGKRVQEALANFRLGPAVE